jgi:hypothetical protein
VRYSLTRHASDSLRARHIPIDWLERALMSPDWSQADDVNPFLEHRFKAIPEFGDRVLRVIVNVNEIPLKVITAFFDRRLRGTR